MTAPPKIKPGASRRLEIDLAQIAVETYHFSAQEVAKLFEMLVAEASMRPVPQPPTAWVQHAFDRRETYRKIKGGFGRTNLSLALRQAVFERDGRTCRYCGSALTWQTYQCDHIKPVALGGADTPNNLTASCEACNRSKGAKPLQAWSARS